MQILADQRITSTLETPQCAPLNLAVTDTLRVGRNGQKAVLAPTESAPEKKIENWARNEIFAFCEVRLCVYKVYF